MAKRWGFDGVGDVLDVGCGVGHWGQLLASVMPERVRVTGVDREPVWVEEARARGLEGRFSYRQGEAQRLPFPAASFDLTTCQTVLIHLPDPAAAITEMLRVIRPGGLVIAAEPSAKFQRLRGETLHPFSWPRARRQWMVKIAMHTEALVGEILVGLDVGTTKVSAVVGEIAEDGITILGVGTVPCRGLRKGIVSNIDWTVRAIHDAIESAQTMAGVEIRTVYAGVAGSHIRSATSDGVAAIAGGEVTRTDVDRALEGARAIPVDADRQILHVLPREFIVDAQDGIRDPVGMSGVRLGAKVNLITAATSCVQNVVRCAERCNLSVADVVLEPLASAEAVLSEDEKEIGVAVIDIGGGTTDILLYVDGGIAHASVIPVGGNNITSDVAAGLRTPMAEADRLKKLHGCAIARMVADDEEIEVPGVGGHAPRAVPRRLLADIIEPRVEEIFVVIRKRLEDTGLLEHLSAGVVLTGGAVLLEGMAEFAEEILGVPVRVGFPTGVKGITQLVNGPQFSTGVGLLKYGAAALADSEARQRPPTHSMMRLTAAAAKEREDEGEKREGSKLWGWLKAAF